MSISHIIAHHLSAAFDQKANLSLRDQELHKGESNEELLGQLKKSFLGRLKRQHGSFSTDGEHAVLQASLRDFQQGNLEFIQLTTDWMRALEAQVKEHDIELDVHFLFFLDTLSERQQVFYLFGVHQAQSLAISDSLEVTHSYAIDTGPSLFGVKVDMGEWQQKENASYITMVHPRNNPKLIRAFERATGFLQKVDKKEATETFLQGVESFAKTLPEDKAVEVRTQIVNHCIAQDEQDRPISIPGLSKELNGIDVEKFVREMSNYQPKGQEEIMVDKRSLQRYVRFSGREKDLAISFSTSHLHKRVEYDPQTDTLVVRALPKALREQLLRHLKDE